MGILIGISLTMYIAFGRMVIFTVLILPVHEHGMSFYFWCLYLSFQRFKVFIVEVLHVLLRFIPRYLFSLRLLWIGVCPWPPSLYVYCWCIEKPLIVSWFCILTHSWICLLFLEVPVEFWGSLMYNSIILPANRDSWLLISLFVSFNSFTCLTVQPSTQCSKRMRILFICLAPDFTGIAPNFSPFRTVVLCLWVEIPLELHIRYLHYNSQ